MLVSHHRFNDVGLAGAQAVKTENILQDVLHVSGYGHLRVLLFWAGPRVRGTVPLVSHSLPVLGPVRDALVAGAQTP